MVPFSSAWKVCNQLTDQHWFNLAIITESVNQITILFSGHRRHQDIKATKFLPINPLMKLWWIIQHFSFGFFLTKLLKDKLIMLMLWRNLYGAVGRWSLNHRHNPDQMTLNTHRVTFLNMFNKFVNIVGETFGDKTVNNRMWNLQSLYSRSRKNCFEVKTTEYWLNRQEFALPRATPLLTPTVYPSRNLSFTTCPL